MSSPVCFEAIAILKSFKTFVLELSGNKKHSFHLFWTYPESQKSSPICFEAIAILKSFKTFVLELSGNKKHSFHLFWSFLEMGNTSSNWYEPKPNQKNAHSNWDKTTGFLNENQTMFEVDFKHRQRKSDSFYATSKKLLLFYCFV